MSNSLAIAATTAVMRDVLVNRLSQEPVASAIGSVTVSTLPPDRISLSGPTDPNQVNLFLYQVRRNLGWANADLPARNPRGARTASPPLAIDLHYLISFYGATPFSVEMLMGEVMQQLHDHPVLDRAVIRRALSPTAPPAGFPTALAGSGLADQMERLRITAEPVNSEETSKLWSALQAKYRPTLAYQVTTVIVESPDAGRPALPVRHVSAGALASKRPVIDAVASATGWREPIAAGSTVRIIGQDLLAPQMRVLIGGVDVSDHLAPDGVSDAELRLVMPSPLPAGMRAGALGVQVVQQQPLPNGELRDLTRSNLAAIVLPPAVSAAVVAATRSEEEGGATYKSGTVQLRLTPPVARAQRVVLLLHGPGEATRSYRLRAPGGNGVAQGDETTDRLDIPFVRVAAGRYLLRVEVDGAASPLTCDAEGTYNGPLITI